MIFSVFSIRMLKLKVNLLTFNLSHLKKLQPYNTLDINRILIPNSNNYIVPCYSLRHLDFNWQSSILFPG